MTAICLFIFREYGYPIFAVVLWLKLGTLFLTYQFVRSYKRKEFYYYQNLGVSKTFLWVSTLSFDLLLYLFLITHIPHR
jgi:hypothetical protein